jgi:hypothetical protein
MRAVIDGIGVLAPGIPDWNGACALFSADLPYVTGVAPRPNADLLPPAERRRSGEAVRWAQPVSVEALEQAGLARAEAAAVFASSSGNPEIVHQVCMALARPERDVSPTRFHNSVHNAAAGYWAIAAACREASTSVACYDASFAAGLLEACTQCAVERRPVLVVAYDVPYPEPLHHVRPIAAPFAVAFVLQPHLTSRSVATLEIDLVNEAAPVPFADAALETLRMNNPAARALPLLRTLARRESAQLVLEYLPQCALAVNIASC